MASISDTARAGLVDPDQWREHATCRGLDVNLFFPERGESITAPQAICAKCPVRIECSEHAIATERFGIWGGTSERERRRVRARRRSAGNTDPAPTPEVSAALSWVADVTEPADGELWSIEAEADVLAAELAALDAEIAWRQQPSTDTAADLLQALLDVVDLRDLTDHGPERVAA